MRVIALVVLFAAVVACRPHGAHAQDAGTTPSWRALNDGLGYRTFEADGTRWHLVRVPLDRWELRVADARRKDRTVATVAVLRDEVKAPVAINGTFFDEKQLPLGLLVSQGKELNPRRDVNWWAALVVRDRAGRAEAAILTTEQLELLPGEERFSLRFAVQVGPRTVVDGRALKLKNQVAARSAVCVVKPDEVVFIATEGAGVESNALAKRMATGVDDGGFGCTAGLMLDGGPSTQLSVKTQEFALDVPGGWGVPNAVVVVPRAK